MIVNFSHRGLENFFTHNDWSGIRPEHAKRLKLILALLNAAKTTSDLAFPGSRLHKLRGERKEFWSVTVSGNWRIIFRFKNEGVLDTDYIDYH